MNSPCDTSLSSLLVDRGELIPSVYPGRTSFAVNIPYSVSQISISVAAQDDEAGITVNGIPVAQGEFGAPVEVAPGRTLFDIEVTGRDGSTKQSYILKIIRAYPLIDWEQLIENAPFPERDSAGCLVFKDRMWVFGGYLPQLTDDVWSSANGTEWEQAGFIGAKNGINIPATFVHNGRMWTSSQDGGFYASDDGASWALVNAAPPWGKRYAAGHTVFAGRMWVMGGHGTNAEGKSALLNDVWSSEDGVDWRLECPAAAWSPRQLFDNVVVKDGKMWVIGGGITIYQPFRAYQDVWCSADGVHWEQITEQAPWPARIWSNCVVYRDRIFLLGGFRAQPTWQNFNDVCYSADGKEWRFLETEACWSERHELSPFVFKDKLWVVAGNAWPLVNDVWTLDISGLSFLSQPVIEQFAGTLYIYRAHADFNASLQPVKYRLKQAPSWLQVNAETGVVSGTAPNEIDDFSIVLEAYDESGEVAQQSYTLHVINV